MKACQSSTVRLFALRNDGDVLTSYPSNLDRETAVAYMMFLAVAPLATAVGIAVLWVRWMDGPR